MNNLINTLRSMTYNTERKSRGQGSAVRQARNKDIARVDRSKGACEESMAERNLIHFDVASPESAISDLPPPLLRSERGPFDGSPDIGPRLETRSRLPLPPPPPSPLCCSLARQNIGNAVLERKRKREGGISLLVISGRSIYDRIGRDGTSSLANRNRDTSRGPASRGTKLKTTDLYLSCIYPRL